MNRRGFLSSLAAALVLDPERALWVPGKKLISVPAPRFDLEAALRRAIDHERRLLCELVPGLREEFLADWNFLEAQTWPAGVQLRTSPRVGERFTIAAVNLINPPR